MGYHEIYCTGFNLKKYSYSQLSIMMSHTAICFKTELFLAENRDFTYTFNFQRRTIPS